LVVLEFDLRRPALLSALGIEQKSGFPNISIHLIMQIRKRINYTNPIRQINVDIMVDARKIPEKIPAE